MSHELVVNLQTAHQIGVTVPPEVLAKANQVIGARHRHGLSEAAGTAPANRAGCELQGSDGALCHDHYYKNRKNALQRLVEVLDIFPSLKERANTLAGALSGGEQQMLAIGRGLMSKPRLLLLDEPSIGLAPLIVQEIFRVLGALKRLGATVLLVEQNARLALANSDRAYVLERGAITLAGNSAELLADQNVQAAYLGKRHSATSAPP